jgi:hypothetical protein
VLAYSALALFAGPECATAGPFPGLVLSVAGCL